jgi:hypothetical protein
MQIFAKSIQFTGIVLSIMIVYSYEVNLVFNKFTEEANSIQLFSFLL